MITKISKSDTEKAYQLLQELRAKVKEKIVWSRDNVWLVDVYTSDSHRIIDLRQWARGLPNAEGEVSKGYEK